MVGVAPRSARNRRVVLKPARLEEPAEISICNSQLLCPLTPTTDDCAELISVSCALKNASLKRFGSIDPLRVFRTPVFCWFWPRHFCAHFASVHLALPPARPRHTALSTRTLRTMRISAFLSVSVALVAGVAARGVAASQDVSPWPGSLFYALDPRNNGGGGSGSASTNGCTALPVSKDGRCGKLHGCGLPQQSSAAVRGQMTADGSVQFFIPGSLCQQTPDVPLGSAALTTTTVPRTRRRGTTGECGLARTLLSLI